jgi:flagellar basal body-associated protein FliL
MASILQDLDLLGSTTGLTIANIRDRYRDYSVEGSLIWVTRYVVIALTVIGLVGLVWYLCKKYLKAKKDARPLLTRFRDLFSSDKQPRDQEMQERDDLEDSDENEDFIVNVGKAARLARDQRARDDLQDELRAEARVRADIHRQSASAGSTGAVSRH